MENEDTCDTPNCVLVAAQVLNQIDETVDPCDDFFLFACGNLVNVTPKEHYPKRLLENRIQKQLQNFLEEPIKEKDHPILNYEKEIYQACVKDKNGSKTLETLKEIFRDLNGWPVVVGSSWDEKNFEWKDWVPKFHKHGLNHMQILYYDIELDSKDPAKKIIRINPPYLFFIERVRDMEQQMLINLAIAFGAHAEAADKEMTEMIDFVWQIAKVKEKYIDYTHVDNPSTRARVIDFQKIHKEMDWLSYFNLLTKPDYTIKPDDYFTFGYADCTKAILDLVAKTPKRTIANYMFYYAIDDLLPVLTSDVFDFYNTKECMRGYFRRTRTEICKEIIRNNFSTLSSFIAYGKKYFTNYARRQITDIFNLVKKEFKKLFKSNRWMGEKNRRKVFETFNTMTEVIGLHDQTNNLSVYDSLQTKLKPQDGFLKMYLHLKSVMSSRSHDASSKALSINDFAYYITDHETIYLRSKNMIILPVGGLQDWYYDEEKPMYVNFATFGKNIGVTFANMITGVHVFDEEEVQWSEETKKGFEEITHCISRKNEDDPLTEYYDYKKMEVGQITGLKIAYNAYQEWVKVNGKELPAQATGYTSSQLFWISALTDACYEDDYGFTLFVHNEPLKQNSNFARDFSCGIESKMNPPRKCNML